MSVSRGKWHLPPAPTPRILHFPRRSSLSRQAKPRVRSPAAAKPNLETLMRQESRRFLRDERRGKVEAAAAESAVDSAEERWRFQVDILLAECNFMRMEREVALRKVEKNRAMMESALRSVMEALIPGRRKIDGRGGSVETALGEEIEELMEKIEGIQDGSQCRRWKSGRFCGNIDRRASVLCRRLQEVMIEEKETSVKEIGEVAEIIDPASTSEEDKESDDDKVEKLRRKMEGLSRGMRERMEEHGLLSLSFNTSMAASEAVAGGRRLMFGGAANRRLCLRQAEKIGIGKEMKNIGVGRCCNCKEFVERIAEQVRAEAEQWSEMQAMLDKVKTDMEELRTSRDMWEQRAHSSELKVASLHSQMLEWKRRPLPDSDQAAANRPALPTLSDQLHSEICRLKQLKIRERLEKSCQNSHGEKVKRVPMCDRFVDSKSNHGIPPRRPPLQEIVNLNPNGIGQLEFASMR